jgi:hypothetical protein
MHKNATKCNETLSKWCENKDGASKIIDTFETYQPPPPPLPTHKSQSYGKSAAMLSSTASPNKCRAKKVKVVPPPVEKTPEEIKVEERAKVKRKLTALRPTPSPKQVFTER